MIKSKVCIVEGCKQSRFSSGYCKFHQSLRTDKSRNLKNSSRNLLNPWKKPIKKISEKGLIKRELKKEYTKTQFKLFQEFYDNHLEKTCFECNSKINELRSYNVHHCLPKAKYKEIALDSKYWLLLCLECHSKVETLLDSAPKVKEYTIKLLKNYEKEYKNY